MFCRCADTCCALRLCLPPRLCPAPSINLVIPAFIAQVDKDTMDMLRGMNMAGLPGVSVQQVRSAPH